jgi:hypothetical protein
MHEKYLDLNEIPSDDDSNSQPSVLPGFSYDDFAKDRPQRTIKKPAVFDPIPVPARRAPKNKVARPSVGCLMPVKLRLKKNNNKSL